MVKQKQIEKKYCRACGMVMIDHKVLDHYNESTGEAYYRVESRCPNWSPIFGLKHSKGWRGTFYVDLTGSGIDAYFYLEDEVKDIPEK